MWPIRRDQGFTLIELLVVFAIAALLIGVIPVAFDRLRESAQYRDTIRGLVSEMRRTRTSAMAQGRELRFIVDLREHTYGLEGQPQRTLPPTMEYRAVVASKELRNDAAAILFLPDGGATGGSIDILRSSGAGVRLRVDWLSGRVTQEPLVR